MTIQKISKSLLLTILLLCTQLAKAIPASDIEHTFTQPNGSTFTAIMRGDEWVNWIEKDGNIIIKNKNTNTYEWAIINNGELVPSGRVVGNNASIFLNGSTVNTTGITIDKEQFKSWIESEYERATLSISSALAPEQSIMNNAIGAAAIPDKTGSNWNRLAPPPPEVPLLVVLVSFNDQTIQHAPWQWSRRIFGTDQKELNHYFNQTTGKKFQVIPAQESNGILNDGVMSVTLATNHPNSGKERTVSERHRALQALESEVDFAAYDTNNNDFIDRHELAILMVYAGWDSATTSDEDRPGIWPHATFDFEFELDNVRLMHFARIADLQSSIDHMSTIGVIAHELGHSIFDLPDLYNSATGGSGIFKWGLMGSGAHNKKPTEQAGSNPAPLSAWCRYRLGFSSAYTVDSGIYQTQLSPAAFSSNVLLVPTKRDWEYFLVDFHAPVGYGVIDSFATDYGFAIWHIDESKLSNQNDLHRLVDIETSHPRSMNGALWPYDQTRFDAISNPNSNGYVNNELTHIEIFDFQIVKGESPYGTVSIDPNLDQQFQSSFPEMNVRGSFNGWNTTRMSLESDNVWFTTVDLESDEQFKFDVYNDWTINFGSEGSTSGTAFQGGPNINTLSTPGKYKITLNDLNMNWTVTRLPDPTPPVADAGQDFQVQPGVLFKLDGTNSTDINNDIYIYRWEGLDTNHINFGPEPEFIILDVGVYRFQLTVIDHEELVDTDIVTVTVSDQLISNNQQLFMVGSHNGWDVDDTDFEMSLINNYTWQIETTFNTTGSFKFTVGNWTKSFGDVNLDGIAGEESGGNIPLPSTPGQYRVTFNDLTLAYQLEEIIEIPELEAIIVVDSLTAKRNELVFFDGSQSTSPTDIIDYIWSTGNEVGNAGMAVRMPEEGTGLLVTLTIRDANGDEATTSVIINTVDNLPPIANAGSDITVSVGETFQFNGSGSSDPDGELNANSFSWRGTGTFLSGATPSHQFSTPGVYTITLEVRDEEQLSSTDTVRVTVTEALLESIYPTMHIVGSHNGWNLTSSPMTLVANNLWEITVGLTSADEFKFVPENWSLSFGDVNHDGTADSSGGGNMTLIDLENNGTGNYVIRFNDETLAYTGFKILENQAPIAIAGDNHIVKLGDAVNFNGTQSSDADGNIVSYHWVDSAHGINLTTSTPSYTFTAEGTYRFTLTVTDNDGLTDTDVITVFAMSNFKPVADAGPDAEIALGESFTFDASGSYDPEGAPLTYTWRAGTTLRYGPTFTITPSYAGNISVELSVSDGEKTDTDYINLLVTDQPTESNHPTMHLVGTHNGWNVSSTSMTLVENNVWEVTITLSSTDQFKFVPESWSLSFGDNDKNGYADSNGGGNIRVQDARQGTAGTTLTVVRFNDETMEYSVVSN